MTTTCVFNLSKVLCSGWNFVSRQSAVFFALEQNDFCSFHEHDSMSKLNVIIIFFFWGRGGGVHFCKAVHGEGLLFVIMTDLYKEVISTGCTTTLLFYLLAELITLQHFLVLQGNTLTCSGHVTFKSIVTVQKS